MSQQYLSMNPEESVDYALSFLDRHDQAARITLSRSDLTRDLPNFGETRMVEDCIFVRLAKGLEADPVVIKLAGREWADQLLDGQDVSASNVRVFTQNEQRAQVQKNTALRNSVTGEKDVLYALLNAIDPPQHPEDMLPIEPATNPVIWGLGCDYDQQIQDALQSNEARCSFRLKWVSGYGSLALAGGGLVSFGVQEEYHPPKDEYDIEPHKVNSFIRLSRPDQPLSEVAIRKGKASDLRAFVGGSPADAEKVLDELFGVLYIAR